MFYSLQIGQQHQNLKLKPLYFMLIHTVATLASALPFFYQQVYVFSLTKPISRISSFIYFSLLH